MPEIRHDPTTGAWCVLSGDRGHRPIRLVTPELASLSTANCPFCPGNEAATMPTLAERTAPDGWRVRAFPNRFPALRVEGEAAIRREGPWAQATGVGAHEVIAESRSHDQPLWEQPEQMRLALEVAVERMADLHRDVRMQHVGWFRNSGALAGASQPHPHAQVVASHVVPARVADMAKRMAAWDEANGRDLLGAILEHELEAGVRIVGRFGDVVVLVPFAPRFSFETWIVPVARVARMYEDRPEVVRDAADAMCAALEAVHRELAPPAYNALLFQAPRALDRGFRWHLRITPRRVALGGFELTTDGTVLHVRPEEAAARLRGDP